MFQGAFSDKDRKGQHFPRLTEMKQPKKLDLSYISVGAAYPILNGTSDEELVTKVKVCNFEVIHKVVLCVS